MRELCILAAMISGLPLTSCGGGRPIPPSAPVTHSDTAPPPPETAPSTPTEPPPPPQSPAPAPDRAPAWAAAGDRETSGSFRFVCQGEGKTPDDATTTARAFCEDKICKLCGVEVESVVQSRETLSGVELSREVIERCRRIRTKPAPLVRQSLDCPRADACVAWIEIDYPKALREQECKRYTDEQFDDPDRCLALAEAFSKTIGYTAAAFRERVSLLEGALAACANIDVRPTPLLNALGVRLQRGMKTFTDEEGRAPRYLSKYWLAPYPPLWTDYESATTFTAKIELLLGYLRSKPPVLDIIEASLAPPEVLDAEAGFARLLELLSKTPDDHGYGIAGVHFFALSQVRQSHRGLRFHQPLSPLWDVLVARYTGERLEKWGRIVDMVWLATVDGKVSDEEWSFFMKGLRWWTRAAQMLLVVEDHGSPTKRIERFRAALARSLEGAKDDSAKTVVRLTKRVLPRSPFVLDLETVVPEAARVELFAYDSLESTFRRLEDDLTAADRRRFLERMVKAVSELPSDADEARRRCNGLFDDLIFLSSRGADVSASNDILCPCLVDHLGREGLSLVSKSELYRRALDLGLPCVGVRGETGS